MLIRLEFIGHLGKDATINQIEGGRTVINFNVANTQKYKDRNQQLCEKTVWISCSYWTKNTAIAPYLLKGTQVYIEGEPGADWYNANRTGTDGIVAQLKCNVRAINLLGKANSGGQPQGGQQRSPQPNNHGMTTVHTPPDITEPIDDLPF